MGTRCMNRGLRRNSSLMQGDVVPARDFELSRIVRCIVRPRTSRKDSANACQLVRHRFKTPHYCGFLEKKYEDQKCQKGGRIFYGRLLGVPSYQPILYLQQCFQGSRRCWIAPNVSCGTMEIVIIEVPLQKQVLRRSNEHNVAIEDGQVTALLSSVIRETEYEHSAC